MRKSKLVTILIALLCLSMLASCGATPQAVDRVYNTPTKLSAAKSGIIAENSRVQLSWDLEKGCVIVTDKLTGALWSSTPYDYYTADQNGGSYTENGLRSMLYVKYYDEGAKYEVEINSFKDSTYVSAKKTENGLYLTYYFDTVQIAVPILFAIEENGVSISLDINNIKEGSNKIISVSVAPFLASAKNNTDSYVFVPSGSGALINVDETGESRVYSEAVYGNDEAEQPLYHRQKTESVRLPVFGVKSEEKGLLAVVTSGAETADICANCGDAQYGYSSAYVRFNVRTKSVNMIQNTGGTQAAVSIYSENVVGIAKTTVQYILLDGDTPDYNTMAATYRAYLVDTEGLAQGVDTPDLMLNFLGGVKVRRLFLGVPYQVLKSLTDFSDVKDILTDISSRTSADMAFNLKGFGNGGLEYSTLGGGFAPSKTFGSAKDFAALTEYCKQQGIDSFFDLELVYFNKSGDGFTLNNAAVAADLERAVIFPFTFVKYDADKSGDKNMLANRLTLATSADKITAKAAKIGTAGVGLSSLSSVAWSDNQYSQYISKAHMSDDVKSLMTKLKAAGLKTFSEDANLYAALASDYVISAPTTSSQYNAFSEEIPFYQMVLRGSTGLSGGAINTAVNPQTEFLRSVSLGCSLGFTLCGKIDNEVITDHTDNVCALSVYSGLAEDIEVYVNRAKPLLRQLEGASIVSYSKADDLAVTRFSNGTVVYTNFGDTEVETELGTLGAKDFIYK